MAASCGPLRGPVLLITYSFPPNLGGTERQAELLATRLRLGGAEVKVLAGSRPGGGGTPRLDGLTVRRVPWPRAAGLEWPCFALSAAAAGLAGPRPSVVHSFILSAPAWAGAVIGLLRGVPSVCKPSAGGPDGNLDRLGRSFYGRLARRFLLRRTDAFVCVNPQVAAELERAGVERRRLRLIPNGVDTARFRPASPAQREELRRRLGFDGRTVALYTGRFEPVKGIEELLQLWGEVGRRRPEALLALAGDGPLRDAVESARRRLSGVKIFPPTDRVEDLYQAADLFVLASAREGMSNALLEAMACGIPAVARDLPGNAAALRHGEEGLLARDAAGIAAALDDLLADEGKRRRMGEAARRGCAARFGIDTVAAAHQDLYRTLCGRNYRRRIPVLAYHRVVERPEYEMDVPRAAFEAQMEWLARRGWRALLPSDLARCLAQDEPFPDASFLITFDDGHRDNLEVALPVLERHGYRACVFLATGFVGSTRWSAAERAGRRRWHEQPPPEWEAMAARGLAPSETHRRYQLLSWDECERLRRAGWEFGAHTLTHPYLSDLDEAQARREIEESKKQIESRLGVPVIAFCYPSGDYDLRVRSWVAEAGFRLAFVTPSHAALGAPHADPLQIERIGVFGSVDTGKFAMLVRGRYQRLRRRLPAWAWRAMTGFRRQARAGGSPRAAHA
jgi:glycosyltransferase involved in cell wall biosynthesis/peptidoglycan/xylan/chitin deacetylase (PgdA/CDA1 family)